MECIGRLAKTQHFGIDPSASFESGFALLKDQRPCAFGHDQAIPGGVKRP
jgi:hypothetical protein